MLKVVLLIPLPLLMWVIPIFTRAEGHNKDFYSWGGWYGTYDNPPEGDESYISKRALYPNVTTGFKGYVNRALWMWRNKLYGYNAFASVKYKSNLTVKKVGKSYISDKDRVPGWYFVQLFDGKNLVGFEFYGVFPWKYNITKVERDVRIRMGWKIDTDKFQRYGFAQLVGTLNPFDGYGDD